MERNCPICLSLLPEGQLTTLPCLHNICTECITQFTYYSNKCPICSKEFLAYESPTHLQHELSKEELDSISQKKKDFFINENFDCLTRKDIENQLKDLKKLSDDISIRLFTPRIDRGSEKESSVLQFVYEKISDTYDLLDLEEFDGKTIAQNINDMIIEIKRLNSRYYKDFIENEPDDYGGEGDFTAKFEVEYIDVKNKHGNKKRKKKYK